MVSITLSLYFRRNTCEMSPVIDLVSLRTSSCLLDPFVEITDHFIPSVCFVALLIFPCRTFRVSGLCLTSGVKAFSGRHLIHTCIETALVRDAA